MNGNHPRYSSRRRFLAASVGMALLPLAKARAEEEALSACISEATWHKVEEKVDRVLEGISRFVKPNGSLGSEGDQQPAATSQSIMAFLSRGHAPGRGRYGPLLEQSLEFVLSAQNAEGIFSLSGRTQDATYQHAISGLMLGEVYGLTGKDQSPRVREAIVKALNVSRRSQLDSPDGTGMRYFTSRHDADLSVTGGHFLFYRSAKNAEFDVPEEWINKMMVYVKACMTGDGGFAYQPGNPPSLAMTSVGLLFLAMTGRQSHPVAQAAARQVLGYDYHNVTRRDYSLYYASLAMSQMGGEYWREFYPRLVEAQLGQPESGNGLVGSGGDMGPVLSSAFFLLSLTPPCQVLPIFQR